MMFYQLNKLLTIWSELLLRPFTTYPLKFKEYQNYKISFRLDNLLDTCRIEMQIVNKILN